jgi:pimeloyl-ACP methyl ester carboxylesterase
MKSHGSGSFVSSFLLNLMPLRPLFSILALALLTGCAQYATVSETKPRFRISRATVGTLAPVEQSIARAQKIERREPLAALGKYLSVADTAAQQLARDPKDATALADYNFAVARVITTIRDAKLDPWTQPLRLPAKDGGYVLDYRRDKRKSWNPALYRFTPADQFDIKGTYVSQLSTKEGVGAALAAVGLENNVNAREEFSLPRTYYGVTAVINFTGRNCVLSFEDPLAKETTTLQGRTFPLAANFTVPIAVMLASTNPKNFELTRVLRPEKYSETARIARLQPYDPNKTVVIVIHGLADTPATWAPMLNALRSDKRIRENYQFWFYSYPSGYPYPYAAAILRRELAAAEKKFAIRKPIVLIGHSMGSCISRLLITDAGTKLWMRFFGKPPAEVNFSEETKNILTESLIFDHEPKIGRVIFISGPHRGSDIASNPLGRFASSLVKAPVKLLKAGPEVVRAVATDGDSLKLKRIPNSVDTLAPNNGFVMAINTLPITPGIPYHSIMGDRGKGGNKDRTKPESSDGVVPYWSSHLDGAQSELIVPAPHSAHQNPQAIAEVRRILDDHAGE